MILEIKNEAMFAFISELFGKQSYKVTIEIDVRLERIVYRNEKVDEDLVIH